MQNLSDIAKKGRYTSKERHGNLAPIFDKTHAEFGQLFPLMNLEHMKIISGTPAAGGATQFGAPSKA